MDTKQVIASETLVVKDENMEIDRHIVANQPVPPDLVDAYNKATGRTDATDDRDAGGSGQGGELTKDELMALSRSDLDKLAAEKGIGEPEALQNKGLVVDAILAASK